MIRKTTAGEGLSISSADAQVYKVTEALFDAFNTATTMTDENDNEFLMQGIDDLGGPQINLEESSHTISGQEES
ncbi:hypothetical protein C5167_044033 [Papaver somniferum]|uniref:Uncharacterized protein n=1 Tax=Papaver somniferum TaxID=3469 RepID=A0A4Y7L7G2_PAPSO|nr:hypothetical protein C5167_044033 [Papaver somniferum]